MRIHLDERLYRRLRELADERGMPASRLAESIIAESLAAGGPTIGEQEEPPLPEDVEELEAKYEQLARELGRVEMDLNLLIRKVCGDRRWPC